MDDLKPIPVTKSAGSMDVRPDAASSPAASDTPRGGVVKRLRYHTLGLVGFALLGIWAYWWAVTCKQMQMVGVRELWIPAWSYIGLDFLHNYCAVPYWLEGGNVYLDQFGDPIGREYAYPPIMLPLFAWVLMMGAQSATLTWTAASAAVFAVAAWAGWRVRRTLGLFNLPLPFVVGVVLLSTPVMFHLERGNCDVIVLLMLLAAVALLRRRASWPADLACAACLAIATWTKVYPVILLPGLLALRRPRPFVLGGLFCAAIGLAMWDPTMDWINRSKDIVRHHPMSGAHHAHSISGSWRFIWFQYDVAFLRAIPGLVGASIILLPLTLWTSWHVYRCPERMRLAYPYLLWLCAAGTFWFPVSMDYKLFFLPLVVVAVWDVKDRLLVQAFVAVMLLWWQPFAMPIPPWPLLLFKLLGLVGVMISLVARARELTNSSCNAAPRARRDGRWTLEAPEGAAMPRPSPPTSGSPSGSSAWAP